MPATALVVVAIQGKAKSTHASEKLGNTNSHIETPHLGQIKKIILDCNKDLLIAQDRQDRK